MSQILQKNVSHLEKWVTLKKCATVGKWVTFKEMCHIWKNGSHLKLCVTVGKMGQILQKNVSQLEKWVTLKKCATVRKMGHN